MGTLPFLFNIMACFRCNIVYFPYNNQHNFMRVKIKLFYIFSNSFTFYFLLLFETTIVCPIFVQPVLWMKQS